MNATVTMYHVAYTAFNGSRNENDYTTSKDAREKLDGIRSQYEIFGYRLTNRDKNDGKLREVWKHPKRADMIIENYQHEVTFIL